MVVDQIEVIANVRQAAISVAGLTLGDAGELHRRTVGKPRDERQAPALGLDRPAQRRKQEIAALLHEVAIKAFVALRTKVR